MQPAGETGFGATVKMQMPAAGKFSATPRQLYCSLQNVFPYFCMYFLLVFHMCVCNCICIFVLFCVSKYCCM